jgi:hypothetical protein
MRWLDVQQLRRHVQILHSAELEIRARHARRLERACFARLGLRVHLTPRGNNKMLWTICVILLVLWALGVATAYTASGLIHILLVVAIVVLIFRLLQGRRVV